MNGNYQIIANISSSGKILYHTSDDIKKCYHRSVSYAIFKSDILGDEYMRDVGFVPGDDPRDMDMGELRDAAVRACPAELNFSSKEKYRVAVKVRNFLGWGGAGPADSVLSLSRVFVSARVPFVIECFESGNITLQFMVQRWVRANMEERFMPLNTQCRE